MTLSDPVQIRLNSEQYLHYQECAARLGKPLATYLRECLEINDREHSMAAIKRELLALRHLFEDWTDKTTSPAVESTSPAMLLESLLLLRQLAKPEQVRIAQGELKRLGALQE